MIESTSTGETFAPPGLIVRTETPPNAEPPLNKLTDHWITPDSAFFVRCHGSIPEIVEEKYSLKIEGLVDKPLNLNLTELKSKFPASSVTAHGRWCKLK